MPRLGPLNDVQFGAWLTPAHALQKLPGSWSLETKTSWIKGRLDSGLIVAAASAFRTNGMPEAERNLAEIPAPMWKDWSGYCYHDFWKTGEIELSRRDRTGYGGTFLGQFHDVRFEPYEFDSLTLLHATIDSSPSNSDEADASEAERVKLPLSDSLLKQWADLFNAANPGASERRARQAVDAMFPDKHVTRTRLRRVLPDRPQGRPLKNNGK